MGTKRKNVAITKVERSYSSKSDELAEAWRKLKADPKNKKLKEEYKAKKRALLYTFDK